MLYAWRHTGVPTKECLQALMCPYPRNVSTNDKTNTNSFITTVNCLYNVKFMIALCTGEALRVVLLFSHRGRWWWTVRTRTLSGVRVRTTPTGLTARQVKFDYCLIVIVFIYINLFLFDVMLEYSLHIGILRVGCSNF